MKTKKKIITLVFLTVFILVYMNFGDKISLENIKTQKDTIQTYVNSHMTASVILYSLLYIFSVAISLPGATVLTLTAGFLFGFFYGTMLVVFSATIGALLIFLLTKYLFYESFYKKFGDKTAKLRSEIEKNSFNYLLFLRLVPLFPFFLVNIAPAFTNIKTRTYILATLIGIIPGSSVYVFAGRELGKINSLSEVASPGVLLAFTLLSLIAIVPVIYKKLKLKKLDKKI